MEFSGYKKTFAIKLKILIRESVIQRQTLPLQGTKTYLRKEKNNPWHYL